VRRTAVARVGAQVLASSLRRVLTLDHNGGEHFIQSLAVMNVRHGHDERQRDGTAVHQQVAFAAFFWLSENSSG